MRTFAWLTTLFRSRWAPAVALTLASIAFAFLAMELAPRAPTKVTATHDRAARSITTSGDSSFAEPARASAPAPVAPETLPSPPNSAALERPGGSPNIVSFFPPPPMTLPPPLEEEEPPAPPPPVPANP